MCGSSTANRKAAAWAAVGLGGGTGTLVRAGLAQAWPHTGDGLPAATLTVNLIGALALGLLLGRLALSPDTGWRRGVRLGVGTGFMGGLTTYSTFMVEVKRLLSGPTPLAVAYWAGSVVAGVAAACLGLWLAGDAGRTRPARQAAAPTGNRVTRAAGNSGGAAQDHTVAAGNRTGAAGDGAGPAGNRSAKHSTAGR